MPQSLNLVEDLELLTLWNFFKFTQREQALGFRILGQDVPLFQMK
jgi:hypothetical protein